MLTILLLPTHQQRGCLEEEIYRPKHSPSAVSPNLTLISSIRISDNPGASKAVEVEEGRAVVVVGKSRFGNVT